MEGKPGRSHTREAGGGRLADGRKAGSLLRAATILTAVALLAIAGVVRANNWGGPKDPDPYHCNDSPFYSECVAEVGSQSVRIESSVPGDLAAATRWSMADYNSVTDVFFFEPDPGETDINVKVRAASYSATWWASTACEYPGSPTVYGGSETPLPGNRWCKAQVFRWNLTYKSTKYPGTTAQHNIACQELGHTLGLRHSTTSDPNWASSCMRSGTTTNPTTTTHDRAHVNARY